MTNFELKGVNNMFMQQAVIRWLEWGGNLLVRIMVLLFIVAAVAMILVMCFQKKKKYEEAFIVYKLLLGVGAADSCTALLFGIFSQNVTILIGSMLAMILFIVFFPLFKHCLQRDFLKNLISSCLQVIKRLDSEQVFTIRISKTKIIVWVGMIPLIQTGNPLSIQLSQAEKWIAKMNGVFVIISDEESIEVGITEK